MFRDLNTGDSILMSAVATHAHQDGTHHVVSNLIEAGAVVNQRRRGDRVLLFTLLVPLEDVFPQRHFWIRYFVCAEPNLADHGANTALHLLLIPR